MTKGDQSSLDGDSAVLAAKTPQESEPHRTTRPKDSELDQEGPNTQDVLYTFVFAIVMLAVASLIAFLTSQAIIPIAICISSLGVLLCGSWVCARKRWFGWYGEFGHRLWSFPGLWYVVFLVGTYIAVLSAIKQYVQPIAASKSTNWEILIPKLAQDLMLAAFLAVLTSVLAHAFTHVGQLTKKLNKAIADSEKANKTVGSTSNEVSRMSGEIEALSDKLKNISKSIYTSATAARTAQRSYEITMAASELGKDEKMLPVATAIQKMCEELEKYHDVALHPILAPGNTPPLDGQQNDIVIQAAGRMNKDNVGELPHYAYMATAIGRYFEAEAMERNFPGVLLYVTSFAYYIRTIQAIVDALKPWYSRYEFYTLMPKCPIELFRFANSTDITEWREFLLGYHKFQMEGKGKWKRYFAFTDKKKDSKGFVARKEIRDALDGGWVLTDQVDFLPRIMQPNDNVDAFFPGEKNSVIKSRFIDNSHYHMRGGYTLADMCDKELPSLNNS